VEPGAFKTSIADHLPGTRGVFENSSAIDDYGPVRRAFRDTLLRALQHGDDPRKAARAVFDVACTPVPRFRYGVGRGASYLPYLKVLLPQSLLDRLLRRGFGLKRK